MATIHQSHNSSLRPDYTSAILEAGDPSGNEQAGLASDIASYMPTRDAWVQLREYATTQSIEIESVVVPNSWADAAAQARPGQLPPGAIAYTVEGTRHRNGVWNGTSETLSVPVAFTLFIACPLDGDPLAFVAPTIDLVGIGLVMNPATTAICAVDGLAVRNVPDSLTVTTANGHTFALNKQQLTHAATIITVGSETEGITRDALKISLMAALTESTLRMLANTGTYPESGDYPNDGNGSDHDSLGLFQMRPQAGWGTVAELMDPQY